MSRNENTSAASLADQLALDIQAVIAASFSRGEISGEVPAVITLERPKNRDHGDYATSIALQLAKAAGKNPREIATILQAAITSIAGVVKVDIAGTGFINITLDRASQAELVRTILSAGSEYGRGSALHGPASAALVTPPTIQTKAKAKAKHPKIIDSKSRGQVPISANGLGGSTSPTNSGPTKRGHSLSTGLPPTVFAAWYR